MGICLSSQKQPPKKQMPVQKSKIQDVDVVKVKLKNARDKIKNFINAKNKDLDNINVQIKQKIPQYEQTGDKKKLIPLLKARKDIEKMIDNADVRLKLINQKISQVQLKQMDVQTINVLDDSNKYIQNIQQQLEQKDWRNVLEQAKQKYQIQWPDDSQQIQEDPQFLEMWNQLGGNKLQTKKVQQKKVNVNTHNTNVNVHQNQNKQVMHA